LKRFIDEEVDRATRLKAELLRLADEYETHLAKALLNSARLDPAKV
jgi:hypothetical protein